MVSAATRFLIAKYVPDVRRGEPRNIGVIVWSPDGLFAKFLGEYPERPGECHGTYIPDFVSSKSTYRQWIHYWHTRVQKRMIDPPSGGLTVPATDPLFLDVLKSSARGNYVLVDGGIVLDKVKEGDVAKLGAQLFSTLVEDPAKQEEKDPTLTKVCDDLLVRSKLVDDPYFVRGGQVITYPTEGGLAKLKFHHAYVVDDHVERLFQRVPLVPMNSTQRNSASTAWLFHEVVSANIVTKNNAYSLVYVTESDKQEPEIRDALSRLKRESTVVNTHDEAKALRFFRALSKVS
jgi:hypothetical protein